MAEVGRRLVQARTLYAAGVLFAWGGAWFTLPGTHALERSHAGLAALVPLAWAAHPVVGIVGTLAMLGLLWLAVTGRSPALGWLWAFVIFFFFARVEEAGEAGEFLQIGHGKFLPGATAGALGIGLALGQRLGDEDGGESRAVSMACGIVAALYFWAGLVKLVTGGLTWVADANLSLLIYERSFYGPTAWRVLRYFVASMPWVSTLGGIVVLGVEFGGAFFVKPRLRLPFALVSSAMHLSIFLLVGYHYLSWSLCVWGLTMWSLQLEKVDA